MPTEMPFSVSVLGVYPSRVSLFYEGVPIPRRATGRNGDG